MPPFDTIPDDTSILEELLATSRTVTPEQIADALREQGVPVDEKFTRIAPAHPMVLRAFTLAYTAYLEVIRLEKMIATEHAHMKGDHAKASPGHMQLHRSFNVARLKFGIAHKLFMLEFLRRHSQLFDTKKFETVPNVGRDGSVGWMDMPEANSPRVFIIGGPPFPEEEPPEKPPMKH